MEFRWAAEGILFDSTLANRSFDFIDINRNANDYWMRVMDIARKFNVPRVKRQVLQLMQYDLL